MENSRKHRSLWTALVIFLCASSFFLTTFARYEDSGSDDPLIRFRSKLSPVLREMSLANTHQKPDHRISVIVKVSQEYASGDLGPRQSNRSNSPSRDGTLRLIPASVPS